jgi:hypothetical protein
MPSPQLLYHFVKIDFLDSPVYRQPGKLPQLIFLGWKNLHRLPFLLPISRARKAEKEKPKQQNVSSLARQHKEGNGLPLGLNCVFCCLLAS